jgi:glycosyltransferase involved in cell wall biosynthesis
MITHSFYETDTRVMQYANALRERGDTVDVLALGREGSARFEVIDGINVFRLQTRKINEKTRLSYLIRILRFLLTCSFVVAKRHLSKRYEVIHVHSVPDFLVFSAIVPKMFGARVILDIHDILPEFYASKFNLSKKSWLFKLLLLSEKISVRFSDHVIIANDLWLSRLLLRSARPGKCSVFINYPDERFFFGRSNRTTTDKFVIIYPGTLNKHQGVDLAVRAFAQVAEKMPGAEFQIYGEGPEKPALMRLARELGLNGRLAFHDFLSVSEISSLMADANLAVVPKRASSEFGNEAASTKIMEFMSLGVPVIVSRTKVDAFYHDASRVRFFESENVAELAETMLALWQDPVLRQKLVAGGLKYVDLNSWKTKKLEYLHLVDTLCLASPARASAAKTAVEMPGKK